MEIENEIASEEVLVRTKSKERQLQVSLLFWLFFTTILVYGVYFRNSYLCNMDIPAHVCAGFIIAVVIFRYVKIKRAQKALLVAFIPFVLWEIFEFTVAHSVSPAILHGIFQETPANKIQDVANDTLGFVVFMIITKRKF
jgi:hypothetical protein